MEKMNKSCAIILAAGNGKRMNSAVKKQFMLINDKPLIYYAIKAFELSDVDEIVVVTGDDEIEYVQTEIVARYGFKKVACVVSGGKERFNSVYNGILSIKECDYVLIHDGARPLISAEIINKNIECVREKRACVTAVPSKDTVKIADAAGYVSETPNRQYVWNIQTPQTFEYRLVKEAYEKLIASGDQDVTDDAMVVERYMNWKVYLIHGDYRNIKVTTPEDIQVAELFLSMMNVH